MPLVRMVSITIEENILSRASGLIDVDRIAPLKA